MTTATGKSTQIDAEVAIVGAGPAGSAAAITCAQHGLRAIIIDQHRFPRHAPGETLHPGVEPVFRQLGVDGAVAQAGFLRHEGHWLNWRGITRYESFSRSVQDRWLGYQAPREILDSILLARARTLGIEAVQPCRAVAPLTRGDRIVGISTDLGPIRAPYVIDASGSQHWLQRRLGMHLNRASPPLVAYYGYRFGTCPQRDSAPLFLGNKSGWIWSARIRPGVYAWTRLSFARDETSREVPAELADLAPNGLVKGSAVGWRVVSRLASDGFFIAGDAAMVLDPACSHGVLRALMSGIVAAKSIVAVATRQADAHRVYRAYHEWLTAWYRHDVGTLGELYRQLTSDDRRPEM